MNAVIYCRVSSKEQIEGTSLESQESACRDYAKSKNIHVLKVFIEQGESAKFADRTQLVGLIEFCREHKGNVDVLLVWKIDRFARNVADHYSVKATLAKYGVRIASVTEPIDANPEGKLMESILAGFAQFDNDIRAMRTVQGMRHKIQEGIFPWKPPLGYKSASDRRGKKTEPDLPNQPRFAFLQALWRKFASGSYTKAEIKRIAETSGVTTQSGQPLSAQMLDKMFHNPYYAGIITDHWSGEEYEGKHVPMVTREEFARVQQVVNKRNRSVPHQKYRSEFPLRGLVRCGACKAYFTAAFSRGHSRQYGYYCCHKLGCAGYRKSYPTEPIHQEFESFLTSITPKPELMESTAQYVLRLARERFLTTSVQKQKQREAVAKLERETQELIRMKTQGLITDDEFTAHRATIQKRRTAIEGQTAVESVDPEQIGQQLVEISAPLCRLPETWGSFEGRRRRQFERLILPVGFVQQEIRTADLGLFFRVLGASAEGKLAEVAPSCVRSNCLIEEIQAFWRILKDIPDGEGETESAVRR